MTGVCSGPTHSSSNSRRSTLQIVLTCRYANCSPMQPCRPPPKPTYANGAFLSSARAGSNLDGSHSSGFANTDPSRPDTTGDRNSKSPFGITMSLNRSSFATLRMRKISGGYIRSVSFMQLCSAFILLRLSNEIASPNSAFNDSCSASTFASSFSFLSSLSPVQLDVIDDVCCPANNPAINSPVISSSVKLVPSRYDPSMNVCSMSGSAASAPAARLCAITL
mmetsp:Transcript_5360/g.11293  ORF Transcript_5360/g.11293 Transcript_5360/m.11293 type:complete len:222 (+) Transcript_5360:218-883(+)